MVVILLCCVIGYGKILLLFCGQHLDFSVFVYINVLNYRNFHTDSSTFLKRKKNIGKIKNVKKHIFEEKLKTLNVYYDYVNKAYDY